MSLIVNYLHLFLRQVRRKKLYGIVSVSGLALSILATLIIANYVGFERSFDTMHEHYDRIYRVTTEWNIKDTPDDRRATTMQWAGPGAKEAVHEVEAFTRVMPLSRMTGDNKVEYKGKSIAETNILLVDPGFFKVFSFRVIDGDTATMLSAPRSVVISETVARKYFANTDPVGQPLHMETHDNLNGDDFTVTGVIEDAPLNSHFRYDILISINSMWASLDNGSTFWHWDNTYSYLLLREGADIPAIEKRMAEERLKIANSDPQFQYWKDTVGFKLQSLGDIHLYSSLKGEIGINSNGQYLNFLVVLALGILISACINFINLSVSRAIERQTEIGIRKVTGSSRSQLIAQLGLETTLIVSMAVVLAIALLPLSLQLLRTLFDVNWPGSYFDFIRPSDFVIIGGVIMVMMLISLMFPLSIVSSVNPVVVLKGNKMPMARGGFVRNYLVVTQFIVCLLFSVADVVLYSQVQFMREQDPGFDREQVVVVKGFGFQPFKVHDEFRQRLMDNPAVASIGMGSVAPGDEVIELSLRPRVSIANSAVNHEVKRHAADDQFFQTLGISLVAGRNFDRAIATDVQSVIVNERAAELLGYKDPKDILLMPLSGMSEKPLTIIGVVKNYHERSYRNDYEPIVFAPAWIDDFGWDKKYHFVKLDPPANAGADWYSKQTALIGDSWNASSPGSPFSYFFLDNYFDRQYRSDVDFSSLFTFFSGFAIVITFLGLFGAIANMTVYRTREIGIRKVLGASIRSILVLLCGNFVRLLGIAVILAIPVVIFVMNSWLEAFAFRVILQPWMLISPVLFIGAVMIFIVVTRSIKVASSNPVDSIKCE